MHNSVLNCVGGLAKGGVRVGVGFTRIRFVCESVRVASRPGARRGPLIALQICFACGGHIWGPPRERVSDSRESGSFASQCESRVAMTE